MASSSIFHAARLQRPRWVSTSEFLKFSNPPKQLQKKKMLQMDIPGFLLVLASVVCYLLAMQWGGVVKSWGSAAVIGTLVGSVVLFVAFLTVEWYQGERALLLRSILKNRTIAHGCAFNFLYVVPLIYSHIFLVPSLRTNIHAFLALREPSISCCITFPIYFQAIRGTRATESGIQTIPLILGLSESLNSLRS
jgi:hypothetical protein